MAQILGALLLAEQRQQKSRFAVVKKERGGIRLTRAAATSGTCYSSA
jgi:hypothetical protein